MVNGLVIIFLIDLNTKVDIPSCPKLVLLFKLVMILSTTVSVIGLKFRFTSGFKVKKSRLLGTFFILFARLGPIFVKNDNYTFKTIYGHNLFRLPRTFGRQLFVYAIKYARKLSVKKRAS